MIETPTIVQTTDQLIAVIRLTIPRASIQQEMGPAIAELREAVTAQGIGLAGPWLSHFLNISADQFDLEVAVPVLAPVVPAGRVQPGRLPATRATRATHHGDYSGLGAAWDEVRAWTEANGQTRGTNVWEVYRVGPERSQNPDDWRTDLYQTLR